MFNVTFERYTTESMDAGFPSDSGFLTEEPASLRHALEIVDSAFPSRSIVHCVTASDYPVIHSRWITWSATDYESGDEWEVSIHFPKNMTNARRAHLCRLLRAI